MGKGCHHWLNRILCSMSQIKLDHIIALGVSSQKFTFALGTYVAEDVVLAMLLLLHEAQEAFGCIAWCKMMLPNTCHHQFLLFVRQYWRCTSVQRPANMSNLCLMAIPGYAQVPT